MRFRSVLWLSMVALVLSLLFALVGNVATSRLELPKSWWWTLALWTATALLAVGSLRVGYVLFVRVPVTAGADDQIVADLAARLRVQWSTEAVRREVSRPAPMLVAWSSAGRPAASRQAVLGDPLGGDWRQFPLRGHTDLPLGGSNRPGESTGINQEIVTALRGLPRRHLVVLGEPGAGKSVFALLLTLGLIHTREDAGEAEVPVLLAINVWDPAEPIGVFVARRLAEDYAQVLEPYGDPRRVADRLVEHRRVLPILDGLDELPAKAIGEALKGLDQYAAADRPLVVTCRSREYEQAVLRTQAILATAAVVELEPVTISAAITYLSYPEPLRHRWEPVFAHLRTLCEPTGQATAAADTDPLAAALSTPLMVSLARTAYQQPGSRPDELLHLGSPPEVTGRLMDAFITAVYTSGHDHGGARRGSRGYDPLRARRWLQCLAFQLHTAGTRDWHWWQLTPEVFTIRSGQAHVATITALFYSSAAILASGAAGVNPLWAQVAGVIAVIVAVTGWLRPLWPHGYPPYAHTWFFAPSSQRNERYGRLLAYAFGGAALTGLITAHLATALTAGLAYTVLAGILPTWQPPPPRRPRPSSELAHNRRIVVTSTVQPALTSGILFAATAALTHAPPATVGGTAALLYGTVAGLSSGGWAWTRYRLTHARLALRGWLPWRLQRFLAHAHQHGILRQAGTIYQFRHTILQDHLALPAQLVHLRTRAKAGHWDAAVRLAGLSAGSGRVDELAGILRVRADAGDPHAASRLADLLAGQGRVDELKARTDTGDPRAASRLADLLARQGRVDEAAGFLRVHADDRHAAAQLADLLARQGHVDEAVGILRVHADDRYAAQRLANLLTRQGHVDEAIGILRSRANADPDDWDAIRRLIKLLAEHGRIDELRAHANAGDPGAASRLADLLAEHGRIDELRARADTGSTSAASRLADLLAEHGRIDELQARADTGDPDAASRLADLLAEHGRIDELQARADTGDPDAASRLANLLAEHGRIDEAIARVHAVNWDTASRLADLLAEQGRVDEAIGILRAHADTGDREATFRLVDLLAEQGRVDEGIDILRACAADGKVDATSRLAIRLAEQGRVDELRARADAGDGNAASRLADLLANQGNADEAIGIMQARAADDIMGDIEFADLLARHGRLDELRARANAGNRFAAYRLADLLAEQGRVDELRARADAGDSRAASRLADLLAEQGRVDEAIGILRSHSDAGDDYAVSALTRLLTRQGRVDELISLLRVRAEADDWIAASRLADLLAEQERVDELRARADAGDPDAGSQLVGLLQRLKGWDR